MIVLDKPPGIAVHKGAGHGDDLERSFDRLRFEAAETPALAHRLDKDTSGCLVLGRSKAALKRLGALFASGRADKTYWPSSSAASPATPEPSMRRSPAAPPTGAAGG